MTEEDRISKRPLSPHLQVYRLPYNALMSISGRAVGIVLSAAMVVLCLLFSASVWFPAIYNVILGVSEIFLVPYILYMACFAIFFYLGNGIRHVLWHFKIGVNEKAGILSGNIVLVLSLILTIGVAMMSCDCWSGGKSGSHQSSEMSIEEGEQNE